MPVSTLKRSSLARKGILIALTVFLVLLFYQISASRLFNAQPFDTDGLIAIDQAHVKESGNWFEAGLPHNTPLTDEPATHYRLTVPPHTPTTGFALLVPSYRYHLEFKLNNETLLTAGNEQTYWIRPTNKPVIIPLDLRERGPVESKIELIITGPIKGRGLDKVWIGPIREISNAHNPVTESLPSILDVTLAALLLLIVFLSIDSRSSSDNRLHLLLLSPHVVLTFLLVPPDALASSQVAFKIYQSSFLITVLAWGAFAYESAGIRLTSLRWPAMLVAIALTPLWLSSSPDSVRAWASGLVAPCAAVIGLVFTVNCSVKRYRLEMAHSSNTTLLLGALLLGAGLSDLLSISQQNSFAQAIAYPYAASSVAFALFARLSLQMSERTRELRVHQHSLSELVDARTEALEKVQSKLISQERFQSLNAMGAAISHEIKGPLGTLNSDLYMLGKLSKGYSDTDKNIIDRMTRSLSRIDRTLSDLSDYAHREQVNAETLNFSNWLQQLMFDREMKGITKGAIVHHEIEKEIYLRFDEGMLRRALINVIKNAINACASRYSPLLLIEASRVKNTVMIRIQDNGTGLPAELGERIYEPLVTGSQSGLGLGLSVVRDIVHLHNGRLQISNRTDAKGAMVCIYLPMEVRAQPPTKVKNTTDNKVLD